MSDRRHTSLNDEAQLRAAEGASYLDAVSPGWAQRINIDTLDMGSGYSCALAQIDQVDYCASVAMRQLSGHVSSLGFVGDDVVTNSDLTAAWKIEILARQS